MLDRSVICLTDSGAVSSAELAQKDSETDDLGRQDARGKELERRIWPPLSHQISSVLSYTHLLDHTAPFARVFY